MIVFEMREAAYNKLFGLVDEVKELDKKRRMIICELEEAVYDCYEASKSEDEYDEDYEEEYTDMYEGETKEPEQNFDMDFRRNKSSRNTKMRGMRMHGDDRVFHRSGLRRRSGMKQYM